MSRTLRILLGMTLAISVLGTAGWAIAQEQSETARVWIDQPIDGSTFTTGPVLVTAHLTHPTGVAEARIDINGKTIETVTMEGMPLETHEFAWTPEFSGVHLIEIYGMVNGDWGTPAGVVVTVLIDGLPPLPPSTSEPTDTTTTTEATATSQTAPPTTTPTTAPTTQCTLGIPSPGSVGGTNLFTPTLNWTYSGCLIPEEFEIQVSRTSDFLRDEWLGLTSGQDRSIQISVGANCTTYFWRIRTYDLGSYGPWSEVGSFYIQIGRTCD